jgi:hypothetical protein
MGSEEMGRGVEDLKQMSTEIVALREKVADVAREWEYRNEAAGKVLGSAADHLKKASEQFREALPLVEVAQRDEATGKRPDPFS